MNGIKKSLASMSRRGKVFLFAVWCGGLLWAVPAAAADGNADKSAGADTDKTKENDQAGGSHRNADGASDRPAEVRAQARIILIAGSQKAAGKLPKTLRAWRRKLKKPPFSAFKSFRVLKTIRQALSTKKALTAVLAGPYVLHIKLLGKQSRPGKRARYRFFLKLTAKRRKRKVRVVHSGRMLLDKGGTFFIAGPRFHKETLILGITLR